MVENAEDWKWSDYATLVGKTYDPLIAWHPDYEGLGTTPEQRQTEYAKWVHAIDPQEEAEPLAMSQAPFIGSSDFGKR